MRYRNQDHKDLGAIKARLTKAFAELRKERGFFARQNFWCCQGCAICDIPDDTQAWVFYHKQDGEGLREGGSTYLSFGAEKDSSKEVAVHVGKRIVETLNRHGLETEWDGTQATRILVKGLTPPPAPATYLDLVEEKETA